MRNLSPKGGSEVGGTSLAQKKGEARGGEEGGGDYLRKWRRYTKAYSVPLRRNSHLGKPRKKTHGKEKGPGDT